jgi:hypothetical protein
MYIELFHDTIFMYYERKLYVQQRNVTIRMYNVYPYRSVVFTHILECWANKVQGFLKAQGKNGKRVHHHHISAYTAPDIVLSHGSLVTVTDLC